MPVGEVAQEILDLFRSLADQHKVQLRLEPGPACACSVWANRQRLNQVLLNLLSNAVKYNRPGGQVTVSCAVAAGGTGTSGCK